MEFIQHSYSGEADMYSLHAWVGMASIVIFFSQFIFGFLCYLSQSFSDRIKAFYMPIHVFFGILCFILAIVASLLGLMQMARFNSKYYLLPPESVLINMIGMIMILYGCLVVYLATKSSYKRPPAIDAK